MYQERQVRAGMALLDKQMPGMVDQIDTNILDISSYLNCALGQVYGAYIVGARRLNLDNSSAVGFGFLAPVVIGSYSGSAGYYVELYRQSLQLSATWRELVTQRRQEHTQAERLPHASPAIEVERELVTA